MISNRLIILGRYRFVVLIIKIQTRSLLNMHYMCNGMTRSRYRISKKAWHKVVGIVIKERSLRCFDKTKEKTRYELQITSARKRRDSGDLVVKDRRVLRWNTRPNITLRQVDQYSSSERRSTRRICLQSDCGTLRTKINDKGANDMDRSYWSFSGSNCVRIVPMV